MKVIKRVALPQPNTINCNMISLVMETPGWVSRVGLSSDIHGRDVPSGPFISIIYEKHRCCYDM